MIAPINPRVNSELDWNLLEISSARRNQPWKIILHVLSQQMKDGSVQMEYIELPAEKIYFIYVCLSLRVIDMESIEIGGHESYHRIAYP